VNALELDKAKAPTLSGRRAAVSPRAVRGSADGGRARAADLRMDRWSFAFFRKRLR
jgi:hypothetical protein